MVKEFQVDMVCEVVFGLNLDEIVFYDVLVNNESVVREFGDDMFKQIVCEIIEKLWKLMMVDWQVRDSVCVQFKILVCCILQCWKYLLDKVVEVIELVMKQVE